MRLLNGVEVLMRAVPFSFSGNSDYLFDDRWFENFIALQALPFNKTV